MTTTTTINTNEFMNGFESAAPAIYNMTADCQTPCPWCAPWMQEIDLTEWYNAALTAYDMGRAYAQRVYRELENILQEEAALAA